MEKTKMSDIFEPKKSRFNNPAFKNMCEYNDLMNEFKEDYEGTWGRFASEKIEWFKPYDTI